MHHKVYKSNSDGAVYLASGIRFFLCPWRPIKSSHWPFLNTCSPVALQTWCDYVACFSLHHRTQVYETGGHRAGVQRFRLGNSFWCYYYWSRLPKSTQNKKENVALGSLVNSSSVTALSGHPGQGHRWIQSLTQKHWAWGGNTPQMGSQHIKIR